MVPCVFREMEAIVVGLDETMDKNMINQGPQFIAYMAEELMKKGVPVVTPPGGLGCHVNAIGFQWIIFHKLNIQQVHLLPLSILISGVPRNGKEGLCQRDRDEEGVMKLYRIWN